MRFAAYTTTERLYDGSNCEVFRGTGPAGRPVVLKILKQVHPAPDKLARFRHEYQTLSSIGSEHVVGAVGLETDGRRWALVMEDFGAQALARQLTSELGLAERLKVAVAVAAGLGDLHAGGVIHKDINPANIVRNAETGVVKLIDFGIATALSSESPTFSNRGHLEGTLRYISPEQTGRVSADVDYRSDLYSLGVTLYQLFTGQLPFDNDDPLELVHAQIARMPVAPYALSAHVPPMVSAIIMRLLEKDVGARYQSAFGLRADLERCLEAAGAGKDIAPFELGRDDISARFLLPTRLYGRDAVIAELVAALTETAGTGDTVGTGATTAVLVTGPAGMGKSAVVRELYGPLTERRGQFVSGKFEQFRQTPFSAVVAAFAGLVTEMLSESDARLERLRNDLAGALGPNGRVITDVIPQVELIIGEQPAVEQLGAAENLNRFDSVFRSFVRVFARPHHPVVLLLDDLQWADPASLSLMERLITDEKQSLLIVGAYRDNEVDGDHPLTATLRRLKEQGVSIPAVELAPLTEGDVTALITDTTHCRAADAVDLAALVVRNTGGNPLFVTEFLKTVAADGLIALDRAAGSWGWNLAEIRTRGFTNSVLDLMVARLQRLGDDTREVLQAAACAGSTFDLETLARLRDETVDQVWAHLLPAVQDGVVVATSELDALISDELSPERRCSFFHDRLQQAAYELMAEDERTRTHGAIGRMLLSATAEDAVPDDLFEVVFQLNRGRQPDAEVADDLRLARLNLAAGARATASTALAAAVDYYEAGMALLPSDAWAQHYELAMGLYRGAGAATYVLAEHERARDLIGTCVAQARTALEKADLHVLILQQHTTDARYPDALLAMRQGLALLDFELPEDNFMDAMMASFGELQAKLGGARPTSFLERPVMENPVARTQVRLLCHGLSAAFYVDALLYSVITFEAMKLLAEHGNPPDSLTIYAFYGHLLGAMFGDPRGGYEFTQVSRELSERSGSLADKCQACFLSANFSHAWVEPLRTAKPIGLEGVQAGLQSGERRFAAYIKVYLGLHDFIVGEPLAVVLADTAEHKAFAVALKDKMATDAVQVVRHVVNNVAGNTPSAADFESDGIDEATMVAQLHANQSMMPLCYWYISKCGALAMYGEYDQALAASASATELLANIPGNINVARLAFYTGVALARTLGERPEQAEQLDTVIGQLAGWAEVCEANMGHTHALVCAEAARARGDLDAAAAAFERAIRLAETHRYPNDHALACELAGRFHGEQGRQVQAAELLAQARFGYEQWGAAHKVALLDAELGAPETQPRRRGVPGTTVSVTGTQSTGALDLASVVKASQAISSEIVLERLLERLMGLVLENAGAQHGVLVVVDDADLAVRAAASVSAQGGSEVFADVGLNMSMDAYPDVAHGVVNYAARTGETVILNDAMGEGAFTREPYVMRRRPRSLLCLPLRNKGELFGFLYLENRVITGAFTADRMDALGLLASQFSISFENARLYNEMEARVERRTEQLAAKNVELEQLLNDLRRTQARLVHAEKMASLGTLTAGVAHEINNPLNFVNNFAQIGRELVNDLVAWRAGEEAMDDAEVTDTLGDLLNSIAHIHDNGQRAAGIVAGMVQHARGGGGGDREPTAINELLRSQIRAPEGGRVHITMELDDAVGTPAMVGRQIVRAVAHLVDNAVIAATPADGSDAPQGQVVVRSRRVGDDVELVVQDNGAGVPDELKMKIFEPFFTTRSGTEGTGLGLSLCHDIVVQGHSGSVRVEDVDGGGARFVLTLPVSD